ncbi:hypothetical protein HK103_004649 [Boothiomyces macroporosus]|uniref:HNH nuclease domain-containing protein n=1 Tax=Boothiomyces macroporosus TaxID=261099 RepID=A0AAD5UNX8_9FUNG|nr:hypothetical protein HK103_004649 [Boothiomyces macroporosus]
MSSTLLQDKKDIEDDKKRAEDAMKEAKDAMNRAEFEMKEARNELKEAEEALKKWKESNPNFSRTNEEFIELKAEKEEKKELYLAAQRIYLSKEETYRSKEETYRELIKRIPNQELEEKIASVIKRTLEESSVSSGKKSRSTSQQDAFRDRVRETCGGRCLLTNQTSWEACHIIPHRDINVNFATWEEEYSNYCFIKTHGIDDVRNGVGLCKRWHALFDFYNFTIRLTDDNKYRVELSKYYKYSDKERADYEGFIIQFTGDEQQWPSAFFLSHHNKNFAYREAERQRTIKAAAEPEDYAKRDSDATIEYHFERLDYRQTDWIKAQSKEHEARQQDTEMVNT